MWTLLVKLVFIINTSLTKGVYLFFNIKNLANFPFQIPLFKLFYQGTVKESKYSTHWIVEADACLVVSHSLWTDPPNLQNSLSVIYLISHAIRWRNLRQIFRYYDMQAPPPLLVVSIIITSAITQHDTVYKIELSSMKNKWFQSFLEFEKPWFKIQLKSALRIINVSDNLHNHQVVYRRKYYNCQPTQQNMPCAREHQKYDGILCLEGQKSSESWENSCSRVTKGVRSSNCLLWHNFLTDN